MIRGLWGLPGLVMAVILLAISAGCSGVAPTSPATSSMPASLQSSGPGRILWGYYDFLVDPSKGEVDIVPLRQVEKHYNALQFMETPTTTQVSLEGPPKFGGGKLSVDIGLNHPFPQAIYTGFDVRGILMSRGSLDFGDGVRLPGTNDFHLLNPDGYTRFWNPTEFEGAGYQDGILGVPYSVGKYDATINGFKYFAQELEADEPIVGFANPWRGAFFAGHKNVRHYEIKIGGAGIKFNYAVDASWAMPDAIPPAIPGDFDPDKANSKEAWLIVPHFESQLTPTGGECSVAVDVYDWQGIATIDAVHIQAPDFFDGAIELGNPVDNGNYFTFSGNFTNDNGGYGADIPLLIRVVDTAAAGNPYIEAFQLAHISNGDVEITLQEDAIYKTPGTDYTFGQTSFELSVVEPPFDYLDMDGPWDFMNFTPASNIHRVIFAPTDPEVSGFANAFPKAVDCFVRDPGTEGPVYRAEEHNLTQGVLFVHGMYSLEDFQGVVKYSPPATFPYPYNKATDFTATKIVWIIPSLLWIKFDYHIKAVGQGWAYVPLEGGTWHNCLYLRTTLDLTSGGDLGQGWVGTLLYLEWIADDGTVVGQVLTGNDSDEGFNFDPDTWEITGIATFMGLKEIASF